MEVTLDGRAGKLASWLARPEEDGRATPGLVIAPGFPTDPGGGGNSFATFPDLADRIAKDARMTVLALAFRGLAESEGNFSLEGWRADLATAIDYVRSLEGVGGIWLLGFGTGGALVVDAAARDDSIRGVISAASPADFADWAGSPRELLSHARRCGAISDPSFPPNFGSWAKELQRLSCVKAAEDMSEKTQLLVMHGGNDDAVPQLDARVIADAHGSAELRIIDGARHHLRHDPRAMAVIVGWLDRRGRLTSAS